VKLLRCIDSIRPENGGPSYSVIESSRILVQQGHDVTIATLDPPGTPVPDNEKINFVFLGPGRTRWRFSSKYFIWLRRHLGSFDAAVVHGVWQFASFGFHLARKRSRRLAYVVMPHGSLDVWDRDKRPANFAMKRIYWLLFERALYRNALSCFFTASAEKDNSIGSFDMSGVRHRVVPYGVVGAESPRFQAREEDAFSLLFLGRLHPKKGIELLLRVFSDVYRDVPNAILNVAGIGEIGYVMALRELAANLGVENKVRWHGHVSGEAKTDLIREAGIFVLPSHQENFGLAVAEALSYGTPVAVSTEVNVSHYVSAHGAGFVFPRTSDGLRDALLLWRSHGEKEVMRRQARRCYEEAMSLERFANCVVDAFS
jgi:glycosyltransferase involved in cell wall biosynthesis